MKPRTGDTLGALVETLRTIQVAQNGHPWLLLELTISQVKALILLAQDGRLRCRELADGLGIAPSATTPLVDRLVAQRLARRQPDPADRRIVWIEPTVRGATVSARLMQMKASVLARVLDEIPARDRPQVVHSLELLLVAAKRVLDAERPRHAARRGTKAQPARAS